MPRVHWSFFMPAEDHRLLKLLITAFRARFTRAGTIIITTLFISADVSSQGTYISSFIFLSFLMGCFITAVGFSYFFRPKITAFRHQGNHPKAGDLWTYKVTVQNIGNRPIRNLSVHEGLLPYGLYDKPSHENVINTIDWLEPGEKKDVRMVIECRRRGVYKLPPLLIGSSFPSGILRKPVKIQQNQHLTVHPNYIPVNVKPDFDTRSFQPAGVSVSSNAGDSDEFLGTREFRQGDRIRDVHWTSSARSGKLIVKEYLEEYYARTAIIIDTQCSFWEKSDGFEKILSTAAALAEAYNRQHVIVDLMAHDGTFKHYQTGKSTAFDPRLLDYIAGINDRDKVDFKALAHETLPLLNHARQAVVLLNNFDNDRKKLLETITATGVKVKAYVINHKRPEHLPGDVHFVKPDQSLRPLP